MTLVTTSRHSTTDSRGVARNLAFALGARYIARGKRGIRDLIETDSSFFIISQEENGLMLRWYQNGSPKLERKILTCESRTREGILNKGIITSDAEIYQQLNRTLPVSLLEYDTPILIADGPQRRQSILKLARTN